jgi:endogenous inhibitor of DNA gyrase (YacG/DUF329 family)
MSACPICGKPARPRADNPSAPFCGPRCKTIDLGKWVDGTYRVPVEDSSDEPVAEGQGNGNGSNEP